MVDNVIVETSLDIADFDARYDNNFGHLLSTAVGWLVGWLAG